MSIYNRYLFAKKLNWNYLVLIKSKYGFVSFGNDNKVLNYLNIKNNYKILNDYKISYIILEDLNIIKVKRFKNNKYKKYLKLSYLKDILNNIGNYYDCS